LKIKKGTPVDEEILTKSENKKNPIPKSQNRIYIVEKIN